jgi:plastocyanin
MCWPSRSVLLLLFALLGTVWLIPPSAALADDQPVQITVSVTDNGFDPATVTVTQGASVELTFVWAETQHHGDEHIIQLSGYNLA